MSTTAVPQIAAPPAIEIRALGKAYTLGQLRSLPVVARRLLRRPADARQPFEALREVTFDIRRGEPLGIVGHNGSGKSTLMQILAGITLPSTGEMVVRGRVLPLLAVGSSFHPELTGRENVLLFGSILGIRKDVVLDRMEEIAAFADVKQHLDTPNKRYSDGMQARLSFAVAMLFPADIYLFDEVLAVIDGDFRRRCLDAIESLTDAGKTVLFISHDLRQVETLCTRVAWMERGRLRALGATGAVLGEYSHNAPDLSP